MKKLLASLLFTMSINVLYSQNFEYDFAAKKFTTEHSKLEDGKKVTVQIKNINRYLYAVKVDINGQTYNNEPPVLFKQFLSPALILGDIKNIGTNKANLVDDNITTILKNLIDKYEMIKKIDDANFTKFLHRYDSFCAGCAVNKTVNYAATERSLKKNLAMTSEFIAEYQKFVMLKVTKAEAQALKEEIAAIEAINKRFEAQKFEEKFKQYAITELNFDKRNFEFVTPEQTVEGEAMNISIEIAPLGKNDTAPIEIPLQGIKINKTIPVVGGWHFSYSSGLFLTNLTNQAYAYVPTLRGDTLQYYTIQREKAQKAVLGFNALVHMMYKSSTHIAIGGHFGVGVPVNTKIRPNILLGISAGIGLKNRLILNAGGNLGFEDVLSVGVDVKQKFPHSATSNPAIPMITQLKVGLQCSLTYNLNL